MFDAARTRASMKANYEKGLVLLDIAADLSETVDIDFVADSGIFLKPVKTYSEFNQTLRECRLHLAGLHLDRYYMNDYELAAIFRNESVAITFFILEQIDKTIAKLSNGKCVVRLTTREERNVVCSTT